LEEHSQTFFPMGRKRRLGESFQDLSRRSGQRIRHDRCDHHQSPPAQRRGSKKGDSDEAIGRSRGGLTTKIHAIVDALGNPLAVSLTGGHVHDVMQAEALTQKVEPAALIGDKGYDSDGFIDHLDVRRIKPVIPPRSNRKTHRECDFALYCERWLVERFFNIIKNFRAIATRYEKTARNFLAGLHLVSALAWLK
jgi:transposase